MEKWGYFNEWEEEMKSLSKMFGAKQHSIDFRAIVLMGIPIINFVSLELEFEDGKKYGQSNKTFREAINGLRDFIGFSISKQNGVNGVCNTLNKE